MKSIRIGNSSGFWGDDPEALRRQLSGEPLDYISADYLAELSMSILAKAQTDDAQKGYVPDFIEHMVSVADLLKNVKTRIVTNAGGNNPYGCAIELQRRYHELGISLKIAIVEGDNMIPHISSLQATGNPLRNIDTGELFEKSAIAEHLQSANIYFGVQPLLKALQYDAQVIITGRASDSALTMAPIIHHFKWQLNEWDKMGAAMIAGHIIECGAQATGGNFTDWKLIQNWKNFGFPIIEMYEDGSFLVTKQPHTGGMVTVNTVKEQLLYEVGDPSHYISPDVIANITELNIEQVRTDVVKISGAKGSPPTPFFKASMAYQDGYKATGSLMITGADAVEKAQIMIDALWDRMSCSFERQYAEMVGYNACHLGMVQQPNANSPLKNKFYPNEILVRFHACDHDKNKLNVFSKAIAQLILNGPQGVAPTGGRPTIQKIFAYWPALVKKEDIEFTVTYINERGERQENSLLKHHDTAIQEVADTATQVADKPIDTAFNLAEDSEELTLRTLCLARSGDKGNNSNIGVIARNDVIYAYLKEQLTASYIRTIFQDHCKGKVLRYEIDHLKSFNFILTETLDGGGTRSLRIDAQGKTFAAALLNQVVVVPKRVLHSLL